ncbi:LysR family transcriptional regulator [Aquabacterium sp. J223]|uniref:LysR family transcriptional regulator n=1 Tax=Aquabacterium sp. J223 TaxID=2898431 RepID=UPI0021AE0F67|nr:LysR family transcriptional regulator [Aquabacterium sp. J223]UUX94435.1 LysR substrate-binding domain-containing protein [Aquabacterium sp. J223]
MSHRPLDPGPPAVTADRLALLATFVRIVEAGSLSAAAAQLQATQPTVSRRLQALERALGLRLLQRSTHSLQLTDDGRRCYERGRELLAGWAAMEADLRGLDEAPQGPLRVLAPHAFGQDRLMAVTAAFLQRHPGVSVEWLLDDDTHNLIGRGIDCAIHVGAVGDESLVAIRLSEVKRVVVGAPSLFGDAAPPRSPADLAALPWLALRTFYRDEVALQPLGGGPLQRIALKPRLSTDNLFALRTAALAGLGLAVVSHWAVVEDIAQGRLLHLVPGWEAAPLPIHLLYPYASFYPARLRRFIEAMREALPPTVSAGG